MRPTPTRAKPAFLSPSRETGGTYTIYVDAPERAPGPWDSVLVMDGDYLFDAAAQAARALRASGRIGPTLVAGVGYGAGFGKPGNFRGRDYTPTASPDEPSSGGADAFLRYLGGTLWGELARRHPLRADRRAMAGHSLGSLLVLHALFQPEPFFNAALASAPSIWWDNRSILGLAARLRDRQARLDASLYLGAGDADTPSMAADLALLERQLSARPFAGLRVASDRFPGMDHYTSAAPAMTEGLARLLG